MELIMTLATRSSMPRDLMRQALIVVLAFTQPVTAVLCFGMGTSFDKATRSGLDEAPIIPAGYTFIIWALIYAATIAYALFQATGAQRQNSLLRRIGFLAAAAMLGTSTWLVMARLGLYWMTVLCIVWMLICLAAVLREFVLAGAPRSTAERWLVVAPWSLFAGYVTAATFANTAAILKNVGVITTGPSETVCSLAMLVVAGGIGTWATIATRGNAAYALAVIWALIGIVVANTIERAANAPVAVVAGLMAAVIAVALAAAQHASRTSHTTRWWLAISRHQS
jgi:hypothetical protein